MKLRSKFHSSLIIIITLLGLFSILSEIKKFGTIYPGYHWKLYSQPLGTKTKFTEYRIYSKLSNERHYHRNAIRELKGFTTDEYVYTFNYFVNKTLEDTLSKSNYKVRLLYFVKLAVPHQDNYKIVSESYNPLIIKDNQSKYDTVTVINF